MQGVGEGKDDWADSFDATFFRFEWLGYQASGKARIECGGQVIWVKPTGNWYWSTFFPRLNECAKLEEGGDKVVVVR